MFIIKADGKTLYAPHLFHEGCGVISPKLTVELNKAGSLEYTLPPTNNLYNDVKKLKTIITVFDDDDELFRGRVLHDEKDFYKQKKVYCEGELAFLLDSIQRPYSTTTNGEKLFKRYISNHNSRVEADKQFVVGNVTGFGEDTESYAWDNSSYSSTLDEINNNLIESYGGYLKTRGVGNKRYIDWVSESGIQSSQIIEFGINMLDITEYITAEDVFTVIIPTGAMMYDEEGNETGYLTISDVYDEYDYIENITAISLFGRIERHESWDNIENAYTLYNSAKKLLDANIEMSVTLTIRAVDLSMLDVAYEKIHLGDWVRVISIPHELDKYFQCTKIVYDLVSPENNEYTFGISYTSLTDKQVNGEKSVKNTVISVQTAVGSANAAAKKANEAAEHVISQIPTDYVNTSTYNSHVDENNRKFSEIENRLNDIGSGSGDIPTNYISEATFNSHVTSNDNKFSEIENAIANIKVPTDYVSTSTYNAHVASNNAKFNEFGSDISDLEETFNTHVTEYSSTIALINEELVRIEGLIPDDYVNVVAYNAHINGSNTKFTALENAIANIKVPTDYVSTSTYNSHVTSNNTKFNNIEDRLYDLESNSEGGSGSNIEFGSYTGTGLYGSSNPNSITFSFAPSAVIFLGSIEASSNFNFDGYIFETLHEYMSDNGDENQRIVLMSELTIDYKRSFGPGRRVPNSSKYPAAKKSSDGKTLYWYVANNDWGSIAQFNESGIIYHYMAIG